MPSKSSTDKSAVRFWAISNCSLRGLCGGMLCWTTDTFGATGAYGAATLFCG
jgi:hypothetical protein